MIAKFLTAAAATAMAAAPMAASAAPTNTASTLSVGKSARAAAPTTGVSKATGGSGIAIALGALIAGGIIYAIVDGTDDDDSDSN